MGKRVLLISIFILTISFYQVNAIDFNKIDSLETELLLNTDDWALSNIYYDIADCFYNDNFDSTLFYANLCLVYALKTEYNNTIADAYNLLAYAYSQKGELKASLENHLKALDFYLISKDSSLIASCYINIGYIISFGKEQNKALRYFLKGMKMAEAINDTLLLSDAYYNIAYSYDRIKQYETAFDYYQTSLNLSLKLANVDKNGLALNYANLAYVKLHLNQLDEFNLFMKIAKNTIPKNQTSFEKANIYSTFISNYIDSENLDSAEHYLHLLEASLENTDFDILKANSVMYKGKIAFLKKNYQESILFLTKSIKSLKEINSSESFPDLYSSLSKSYAASNQYQQAYHFQIEADSFRNLINTGAVEATLTEFEQNKIHETELQRNKLEMELEQQKIVNTNMQMRIKLRISILAIFLLTILILSIFLFLNTLKKNNTILFKKNELIQHQQLKLEKQVSQLEESEDKLKKSNNTKDKFFSIIAHDLRNPFHSIIGLTRIIREKDDSSKIKEVNKYVESMHKTAINGYSLLENLLEWSKTQTGSIKANPEKIQIEKLINIIIQDFQAMTTGKQININLVNENHADVLADINMTSTVLRNLLHNAIKFSHEKSKIEIQLHQKKDNVVTIIKDEGIGISQDDLENIFSVDNQVRKVGTNKEKGSGLGLILCKEFIEINHGKLLVERNKDEGCTFSFSLPIFSEV